MLKKKGMKCDKCLQLAKFSEHWDCYFCPKCNMWLEDKCYEPDCPYCKDRPEKPISKD